ncbi:tellurite resistance TerB family protein [Pseudonocardia sp. N23]|uniref:tellurite resistance TerB family protein n=1 Tax=Pseudonocardia sp. N23 TaxID=1987376 RepID=UPI000BFC39FE|nr:TerB family tellurite resistance protein [Pseudonocardia sp. N23]GAY11677.1 tellurite resistance protein TerB [Pseudonocardia sp. N23]
MALWDQLKERAADMSANAKTQVGKFKNKDFANASMAICALIAAADGTISPEERSKTAGFITSNDVLSIFPASELLEKFTFYASKLEKDYDFGKVEAIQTIAKLKSKQDAARAVIQVGIIIGGADGDFDDDEKQAVREACNAVGIAPSEFDL